MGFFLYTDLLLNNVLFQIKELTEQMMSAQNEMEKALRDKVELINQLETAKLHIKRYDQEVSLVS